MQGRYGRVPGMGKSKLCTAGAGICVLPAPKAGRDRLEMQAGGSPRAQPSARNSFSISHIMPNKSFPVSRVFTDRRQQHPRAVQAALAVQLEGTSTTTAAEHHGILWGACARLRCCCSSAPLENTFPPMACPASRSCCCHPPRQLVDGSSRTRDGLKKSTQRISGLRQGDQDLLENTKQPCSGTPIRSHTFGLCWKELHSRANLMFKGSKETPENCMKSTSSFPDLLL